MFLSLLFVSGAAHAGHKLQREERKTVDVTSQTRLLVKNAQGRVIVVGTPNISKVTITAEKWVQAKDAEAAAQIMRLLTFDVETRRDDIEVVARQPRGLRKERSVWALVKGEKKTAYIDFTIEVPRSFDVKAATTSGDVRITNIDGATVVNATSGDVELREIGNASRVYLTSGNVNAVDLGGDLEIAASSGDALVRGVKGLFSMEATSGNVEAFEIEGDALIKLFNGDLVIEGCLGDLEFKTASGDARIAEVLGNIKASSSSGDLDVVIIPVGEKEFFLNTSSGNIDVYYLTTTEDGFLLDVNTCSGTIHGDLQIKLDKVTRQRLKGIVGTGKSKVIVETASGNVFIKERAGDKK
jgi:hypothetical protein